MCSPHSRLTPYWLHAGLKLGLIVYYWLEVHCTGGNTVLACGKLAIIPVRHWDIAEVSLLYWMQITCFTAPYCVLTALKHCQYCHTNRSTGPHMHYHVTQQLPPYHITQQASTESATFKAACLCCCALMRLASASEPFLFLAPLIRRSS
jgi:hypothetical protein